jgi:hypothetical protein
VEKADGELIRESHIPVAADTARDPRRYNLTDLTGGPAHLRLSLMAENRAGTSEPARLEQAVLQDGPGQLEILRLDEAAASLKWRGTAGIR